MRNKIIALTLCAGLPAHAEFKDGNKLLSEMGGSVYDQMNALGYVTGVVDALQGVVVCNPANVTAGQVNDMV